jgi:glycosyltransferase involved in cell wall biosynthesis
MIVRDESAVIERCLASAIDKIDTWSICDTGSTDGTQELIRSVLAGIPGELHERPWVNFGHNRSEALALARGRADYLLLLDADMTVDEPGPWPARLPDACLLKIPSPELDYRLPLLVRGDREWRSEGATHEYLATDGPYRQAPVNALVVYHHLDGSTRPEKLERDLRLLRGSWRREQKDRTAFYLAQTYRDMGDWKSAVRWYERRVEMGGWEEEVFFARMQVGIGKAELGDWPAGMQALIEAWEGRPHRLEPVYELVSRLRMREQYWTAHRFARVAEGLEPLPVPDDVLFVSPWIYRWGLLFEYSITAYWVGEYQRALAACDRLLKLEDLPARFRAQTEANRQHCLAAVARVAATPLLYPTPTTSTPTRPAARGAASRAGG